MTKGRASKTNSPVKLLVPREEAIQRIKEQIQIGRDIRDQKTFSMMGSGSAQEKRNEWVEENIEILTSLFTHPFFEEEYNAGLSPDMDSAITFGLKEKYFKEDMDEQIERLESISERLKFIPESKAEERIQQKPPEEPLKEHPSRKRPPNEDPSKEVLHRRAALRDEPPPPIGKSESISERLKFIPESKAEERIEQRPAEEPFKEHPSRKRPPNEDPSKEVLHRRAALRDEPPPPIGKSEYILERLKFIPESKGEERIEQRPAEEPFKEHPSGKRPPNEDPSKEVLHRREVIRNEPPPPIGPKHPPLTGGHILLIHGRDAGAKESVLKFVGQLGLRALTLQEQPNGGRSIVEKFGELSNTQFAIILFTPDEIAVSRDKSKERQIRVSQHVMFEFGYVVAKLGHRRVCALYDEGVEIPSEVSGVVSIPMDFRGGWRLLVAKEFKQAGVEVDLNKAI